ncbi:MAG: hypothetical protein AAFY25_13450 [Pseudomonadota bacterium]
MHERLRASRGFGIPACTMTNQLALLMGFAIVTGLTIDAYSYGWENTLFLARKLLDLIEWLKFWR